MDLMNLIKTFVQCFKRVSKIFGTLCFFFQKFAKINGTIIGNYINRLHIKKEKKL